MGRPKATRGETSESIRALGRLDTLTRVAQSQVETDEGEADDEVGAEPG